MEIGKKKVGLFLPIPLADALDQMTVRVGKKQKWLIISAALLRLMQSDEGTQNELIREVKIADLPGGSYDRLIASAKLQGQSQRMSTSPRAADFQQLVAIEDTQAEGDAPLPRNWPRHPAGNSRPRDKSKAPRRSDAR